ncbi:MAG: alcohol dehydrogenase catalytic domain-containing protein [Victivallales bacterium]|nr:alcohol dehydrogenase catalytic domain-containing protein [Victivallales bacterium]
MKAAVVLSADKLAIKNVPDLPQIGAYQCLCRNIFASACTGTDQKIIHDKIPWGCHYPAVLGHETVGEIVEIGPKARNFSCGDVVLRPVYGYAGQEVNGLHNEFGGFSEFGIITDYRAMRDDGLAPDAWHPYSKYQMKIPLAWKDRPESVIFITMKETFSWIQRLGSLYGKKVGIVGAGAVGMFYVKLASVMFASEVTSVARRSTASGRAIKCGADCFISMEKDALPTAHFDILIDAAGLTGTINSFIPSVKPGGTVAFYGLDETMDASFRGFGSGLVFSFHSPAEDDQTVHDICVSLVEKGIIDMKDFHSSVFPFARLPEAFEKIERKEEFKPIFTF